MLSEHQIDSLSWSYHTQRQLFRFTNYFFPAQHSRKRCLIEAVKIQASKFRVRIFVLFLAEQDRCMYVWCLSLRHVSMCLCSRFAPRRATPSWQTEVVTEHLLFKSYTFLVGQKYRANAAPLFFAQQASLSSLHQENRDSLETVKNELQVLNVRVYMCILSLLLSRDSCWVTRASRHDSRTQVEFLSCVCQWNWKHVFCCVLKTSQFAY